MPSGERFDRGAVAAMAALAAAAAVLVARRAVPHLSINNDEAINLLQAEGLARGELFLPTGGFPDAFRPWLAAVVDDRYVLKYTPLVPAFIAASLVLTGGPTLHLAVVAAALVGATWALGRELLGDGREALVATALVAASPLVVVQSGLLLSYLPTLVLLELGAWALVRGARRGSAAWLAASGLALGLAFFARAYDAVVVAAPLVACAALGRGLPRPGWRAAAAFTAGGSVGVAAFLAYNAAATGSPLHPTFSLLEPSDTFGFGVRKLQPDDDPHPFGPVEGIVGVLRHAQLLGTWAAGGVVLAGLAVATVVRRRAPGVLAWVAAIAVLVPVSHLWFWGAWNATVVWGGTRFVGPFYFVPVLVPLALLAARGLVDLARWRAAAGAAAALAIAALVAQALVAVVPDHIALSRQAGDVVGLVDRHVEQGLVFVPGPLMHPVGAIRNSPDLDGPVLWATSTGPDDVAVAAARPDRPPHLLRYQVPELRPGADATAHLLRLRLVRGERLELVAEVDAPRAGGAALDLTWAGTTRTYAVAPGLQRLGLALEAGAATVVGATPVATAPARRDPEDDADAGLQLLLRAVDAGAATLAEDVVRVRAEPGRPLAALVPTGERWTAGPGRRPALRLAG